MKITTANPPFELQLSSKHFTYQIISATFCLIVVLSNIISAKMFTLPVLGLVIPMGLITYPITFLLSDLVTEIYGSQAAKRMVYMTFGLNILSFFIIQMALWIPSPNLEEGKAFHSILGLSGLRIFSSLISYLTAQIVDIQLYALIKKWTGPRFLWLRNNASTCISQIVDTVMIDILFLYWGLGMSWVEVWPIMVLSYAYKAFFSVANTPIFYICVKALSKKDK